MPIAQGHVTRCEIFANGNISIDFRCTSGDILHLASTMPGSSAIFLDSYYEHTNIMIEYNADTNEVITISGGAFLHGGNATASSSIGTSDSSYSNVVESTDQVESMVENAQTDHASIQIRRRHIDLE